MSVWGGEAAYNKLLEILAQLSTGLTNPVTGKKVNQVDFTWNADGSINTIIFKETGGATLFTLTFSYSAGNVISIVRS